MALRRIPHVNYYEGILQVRDPTDEVIEAIRREFEKEDPIYIRASQKLIVRNGVDYYISSKKFMQNLAKKLYSQFGGEIKSSPQLYSRDHQTSKEIYRLNIYYKPSQFKKDDIVTDDKKVYKVTSCSKKISAINLETEKKTTLNYEDVSKVEKTYTTMVSSVRPSLEVLDPETYQPISVKNSKFVKVGEKVKIVKIKEDAWLI